MDRFMDKVELIPFHPCWEWTGHLDRDGYGIFWKEGKNRRASQVSYELFVGPFPFRMLACHSCDNPSCVNPKHIWPGTHGDNHKDRNRKGRQAKGATAGQTKLTDQKAKEICEKYKWMANGASQLAAEYGVTANAIVSIIKGRTWSHATDRKSGVVPGKPIKRKIVDVRTWTPLRGSKDNLGVDALLECGHWTGPRPRGFKEMQNRTHLFCKTCGAEASVGADWATMEDCK